MIVSGFTQKNFLEEYVHGSSDDHKHCTTCVQRNCKERANHVTCCELQDCPKGCQSRYHACKQSEHLILCSEEHVECTNKHYGCPLVLARKKLSQHLMLCPASVVYCSAQWNRSDIESGKAGSLSFLMRKIYTDCGQLDTALALRDHRILVDSFQNIARIPQNSLTPLCPAGLVGQPSMQAGSTHVSGNDEMVQWTFNKSWLPVQQKEMKMPNICRQTDSNNVIGVHNSISHNIDLNSAVVQDKFPTFNLSKPTEEGSNEDEACGPTSSANSDQRVRDKQQTVILDGQRLNSILSVSMRVESVAKYQAKPNNSYTLPCAQEVRREEFSNHFYAVHNRIQPDLDSWLEQRCPLAYLGCPFSFRRLQPGLLGLTVCHSWLLESFGLTSASPHGHVQHQTPDHLLFSSPWASSRQEAPVSGIVQDTVQSHCIQSHGKEMPVSDIVQDTVQSHCIQSHGKEMPVSGIVQDTVQSHCIHSHGKEMSVSGIVQDTVQSHCIQSSGKEMPGIVQDTMQSQCIHSHGKEMSVSGIVQDTVQSQCIQSSGKEMSVSDIVQDTVQSHCIQSSDKEVPEGRIMLCNRNLQASAMLCNENLAEEEPQDSQQFEPLAAAQEKVAFASSSVYSHCQTHKTLDTHKTNSSVTPADICETQFSAGNSVSSQSESIEFDFEARLPSTVKKLKLVDSERLCKTLLTTAEKGTLPAHKSASGRNEVSRLSKQVIYTAVSADSCIRVDDVPRSLSVDMTHLARHVQFCDLPVEILLYITKFLDSFSLSNLSLVSRTMRELCSTLLQDRGMVSLIWKKLHKEGRFSWQVLGKRWRFSSCFEHVPSWIFTGHNPISHHLITCPYNQDQLWHSDKFSLIPMIEEPGDIQIQGMLEERLKRRRSNNEDPIV